MMSLSASQVPVCSFFCDAGFSVLCGIKYVFAFALSVACLLLLKDSCILLAVANCIPPACVLRRTTLICFVYAITCIFSFLFVWFASSAKHLVCWCVGSLFEVKTESDMSDVVLMKTEADSHRVTEHPHHDKPRLHTACRRPSPDKGNLNEEMQTHLSEEIYRCSQCDKCFPSQPSLSRHVNSHTSKFRCTECGKCLRSRHDLTRHRRIHSGEKPFACSVCGKRFSTTSYLVVHKRIHSGAKLYKCSLCNRSFSRSSNLQQHNCKVHFGDNVYSCSQCDKSFSSRVILHHHRNVHTSKFKCTECGKCFRDGCDLSRHIQSHSGEKLYECVVCNKRFTAATSLVSHRRIHAGDKPYTWLVCTKSFGTPSHLQKHNCKIHTIRRPYCCFYCGAMFTTQKQLKCHIRIHTGTKSYSCRHCSERFTRPDQLKTHLLKSHREGTWLTCRILHRRIVGLIV